MGSSSTGCVQTKVCPDNNCFTHIDASIESILHDANKILDNWTNIHKKRNQSWKCKRDVLNKSWAELRSQIMETVLHSKFGNCNNDKLQCSKCNVKKAMIRCEECKVFKYLCGNCDMEIHNSQPYHDRYGIINGYFQPISADVAMNDKFEWVTVGKCF